MRSKLVVGNWKMNGSLASNSNLLTELRKAPLATLNAQLAVCVPFPYLASVSVLLSATSIALGAQNVSEHAKGAFTGEVSAAMLVEFGCRFVLVGHSERRSLYGESDSVVSAKFASALDAGLKPILCVGESLAERESGATIEVVSRQIDAVIARSGMGALADAVVAYEPVWAIGTGRTASPAQAQEVHAQIRARVAAQDASVAMGLQILYGGSMKPDNAVELLREQDIDGGLIGGASLVAEDFLTIARAA